jgi:hypothetical protein
LLTHEQLSAGPWQVTMICSLDKRNLAGIRVVVLRRRFKKYNHRKILVCCGDRNLGSSGHAIVRGSLHRLTSWGSEAATAQGYCPFVAFCDAQHYHCYRNCGALTDVVAWPARPPFLQQCYHGCERQLNRCMYRAVRWCR